MVIFYPHPLKEVGESLTKRRDRLDSVWS